MRIYTCTPVAFGGGADFFARDSGLLCRGFQMIGIDSRAVMPGERQPEDESDLIRTEYRNLESTVWWRSQQVDGVVLYAWGRPKFRKVAAAIHEAGIFLVLNLDSGGLVSPLVGWRDWLHAQWIYGGQGRGGKSWFRFTKLTLHRLIIGLLLTDPLRARHLKCGNAITCVSPRAAEYFRRLCRIYGGEHLAARIRVIPHAVEQRFRYSGKKKQRQVACVGRWMDQVQKRTWLLMEVIGALLSKDDQVMVVIAGQTTPELEAWHHGLEKSQGSRVRLAGIIGREELAVLFDESQVFYSPSAYESFGIAAAEALCEGCSVVAERSVALTSFDWFVSADSGTLAASNDVTPHLHAIQHELAAWQDSKRAAEAISRFWCERLYAGNVATLIRNLIEESKCED
jgi:hypothetical protein